MRKIFTLLLLCTISLSKAESLETYEGVDSLRSTLYKITLTQGGESVDTFVYEDSNKFSKNDLHRNMSNHWTNFSFEGEVDVEISLLKGAKGDFELRPLDLAIDYSIDNDKISFTISEPSKIFLKSSKYQKHPLFIFANAPVERPNLDDEDVVYWGAGVHNIGKHFLLESGKTYFLDGGAYLKGSFLSEEDAHDITVCGNGILSGEEIEHGAYKETRFDRMALRLLGEGECNFNVRDITIINPGQYCIQAYGGELHTSNVKCFGWWYETDGWVGGDGSTLRDSFFKVYDDIVKIYFDDLLVEDLTIYKQNNGAVFQFGWSSENSANALVSNIFVVEDDTMWNQRTMEGNRGFLNTATGNQRNRVVNFTAENIVYDGDLSYLLGINSRGIYDNILIKNMRVRGEQRFKSYLSGGDISNVILDNVTIDGRKVDSDKVIDLHTGGNVAPVIYK